MFDDRADAGRRLAVVLQVRRLADPVVLALPRGGVPVAVEVAEALGAPLEVFVSRKVGAPGQPELGIGAVAEGGGAVVDQRTVRQLQVSDATFADLVDRARQELVRRVATYRGDRPLPALSGRDVVVVDDGLATGVTAEAALVALRSHEPRTLLLAVPVCPPDTAARLGRLAEIVALATPEGFMAVGAWYRDFTQVTDDEVLTLVAGAHKP